MQTSSLRILMIGLTSIAAGATPLMAQATAVMGTAYQPPSDAQMAAMQVNARKMQHPAEWVLEFKQDLNLRPDQVEQLQALVLAQRDSEPVRMSRRRSVALTSGSMAMGKAMMDWGSRIDEQAIRDAACEQSKQTAEYTLDMMRDQHAVGAILTEAQRHQIPTLQAKLMMNGMAKP